ncbi:hypothetical protein DSCO28_57000 [Desulfosarcina ovata subsp. sediminis]|uniref:Zinc/iron-chelating domain-containing protein n=1 Tax=Desulfosarcina ovata subsp. sediminis TaxID=885957 RepID=A0A5K7ZYB5_9BACT|nr:hypothetical protein [Desulfosarcina ovata]BBO85134.1 hypothetical protein DSCO28_57000 [Desulfosarcina ovata subsp. sediminis]
MQLPPDRFLPLRKQYLPLLDELQNLFQEMDRAYDAVATRYGFKCNGCKNNCCLTRFYHHTLLERLYLLEGVRTLSIDARMALGEQARTVNRRLARADREGRSLRIMCPLNEDGRCRLYAYRPMICRLHGIPHELHPPGGRIARNPGCDAFFEQCRNQGRTNYIPFDRTPFYRKMAILEKALRNQMRYTDKIRLTIAEMLESFTDTQYEIH